MKLLRATKSQKVPLRNIEELYDEVLKILFSGERYINMDMIQLTIIAIVVALILVTIGYYLYKEAKFKKMVENNFNQAAPDVIVEENRAFTLDGINTQKQSTVNPILQKDVAISDMHQDPLFDDISMAATTQTKHNEISGISSTSSASRNSENITEDIIHPEHSVEAFFANIHKVTFPFAGEITPDLDFIVDIGFEELKKIKILPEITQFTNKPFKFYVLDKNNQWLVFNKGEKYVAQALKLVVWLVDNEGIISQAQLSNIFNELHKFVMQNHAHIYKSDYETAISKIQGQVKHLEEIELNLSLFIIMQDNYSYSDLLRFFSGLGLVDNKGIFQLCENNRQIFNISAENGAAFSAGNLYNLLQITASLHKQKDPNYAVEKIFDYAEKIMHNFEARLLTSNKHILGQKDYDAIIHHVKRYMDNAKLNGLELGGELINRVF